MSRERSSSLCKVGRPCFTRRQLLAEGAGGLGGIALSWMLARDAQARTDAGPGLDHRPRAPHVEPRAKSVIFLFMGGGPSQMDLFDPKPALTKYDGQPAPFTVAQRALGGSIKLMGSPFRFRKYGQSGIEVSDLMPNVGQCVDDLAVIRSACTNRIDHGEANLMYHTGRPFSGFPSLGCWITYGLGTENESMPAYVAIPETSPARLKLSISSGWLPALYQGTPLNAKGTPIFDLKRPTGTTKADQRRYLDLTQALNRRHQRRHPRLTELDARIKNFELAARMQGEAMRQVNVDAESRETLALYGIDNEVTSGFGTQCLIARRLVESGVRFVHLIRNDWDHHSGLKSKLTQSCLETDRPIAGLLRDLKQRGLLEQTLVVWGGEFGRLPVVQGSNGRDHNPYGFCVWLAGGGTKGGTVYGATDDFSYAAVENKVQVYDLHATILHLLGLDHQRLIYPFEGREERLTGSEPARVIRDVIA